MKNKLDLDQDISVLLPQLEQLVQDNLNNFGAAEDSILFQDGFVEWDGDYETTDEHE